MHRFDPATARIHPRRFAAVLCSIALACTLPGCAPHTRMLAPTGEMVRVTLARDTVIAGELLTVGDTALCVYTEIDSPVVHRIRLRDVATVEVLGYVNRLWPVPIIAGSAVIGAIGHAYFSSYVPIVAATAALLAGFAFTTPSPPRETAPIDPRMIDHLRTYARFPRELTERQWKELMKQLGTVNGELSSQ